MGILCGCMEEMEEMELRLISLEPMRWAPLHPFPPFLEDDYFLNGYTIL